jgi:hypothetical protein
VYLAPAQIHEIPPILEKAGVDEKCLKCKNSFDVSEIDELLELWYLFSLCSVFVRHNYHYFLFRNKDPSGAYSDEEMPDPEY